MIENAFSDNLSNSTPNHGITGQGNVGIPFDYSTKRIMTNIINLQTASS